MLSPTETELRFGHRIRVSGSSYVVTDQRGQTLYRTRDELKASRMLRHFRSAFIAGRYHATDAPPVAGRIGVA